MESTDKEELVIREPLFTSQDVLKCEKSNIIRRPKRSKTILSETNSTTHLTHISKDRLDDILYHPTTRRTTESRPIMTIIRFAFICIATISLQLLLQDDTSQSLFTDALDQTSYDQISPIHSEKKEHSTLRSVVDKVLQGGELQSILESLDLPWNSNNHGGSNANGVSRTHSLQQHHISSKRGDLYDWAIHHPIVDVRNSAEAFLPKSKSDLIGKCATYVGSNGYWTYEWCHGKSITQRHLEQHHSLGKYQGEIYSGVELYEHGDICDDVNTNKQRSTQVIYQCCSEHTNADQIFLDKVTETELCTYKFYVCRPSKCITKSSNDTNIHLMHENLFPPMSQDRKEQNKELIQQMFTHAYDSYMYNAHPAGELRPLSCKAGSFDLVKLNCLTLIDTLDSLLIFGNKTEFARSVERLRNEDQKARKSRKRGKGGLFDADQNVSVFETNIRVLGGLLSAHQLALVALTDHFIPLNHVLDDEGHVLIGHVPVTDVQGGSSYWSYDGFLLQLAEDMGNRLLPSFDSKSGIPFGTVNLRTGVPKGETPVASLAGGGTLTLEMELLSRLTGNPDYGKAAKLATRALWVRRSPLTSLLGKHIDVNSGKWKETLSGIGSNSDSFYEYLLKHYILYGDDDFWLMFVDSYEGIMKHVKTGDWYSDVDMTFPQSKKNVMESLQAFWPGVQILLGELVPAAKTLNSYFLVREELGFLPERFHFDEWKVDSSGRGGAGKYPLRPELLESAYLMHRALHSSSPSSGWEWAMEFALATLQRLTWTECGYASVKSVRRGGRKRDIELDDDMPSFFLSETLKYLYLIYDEDNFLHEEDGRDWVFTTEAHPIHHVSEKLIQQRQGEEEFSTLLSSKKVGKKRPNVFHHQVPQQWTPSTKQSDYLSQIQKVEKQYNQSTNLSLMDLFYGPTSLPNVTREEQVRLMDLPELHFFPHGREASLPKLCVNHYHSSLDWMHALNGNAGLEYEEVYDSILTNDYDKKELLSPYRPHHKKMNGDEVCEISERVENKQQQTQVDQTSTRQLQTQGVLGNRYDMGEIGSFDVTAFEEGFFVNHVETNEAIEVTAVQGDAFSPPAMFMIRASVGNEDRMIIADDKNNAFICEFVVKFVQRESEKNLDIEIARIPCSPAMFGPTELHKLVASGGIIAEGTLISPLSKDITGCKHDIVPTTGVKAGMDRIQMVMRGECAFHEKAVMQKINQNAKGVVVVNTQPGQLFVMDTSETKDKVEEEPVTILITNEHGRELMKRLRRQSKQSNSETNDYIGSIQLNRIPPSTPDGFEPTKWPYVESSPDRMQILSKSKWGVIGNKVFDENNKVTWKIMLLQHGYDLSSPSTS